MEPLHWTRVVYSSTSDILHSLSSQAQPSSILPILPTAVIIITFYLYHIYITRRPDATKKWSTVAISRLKLLNSHFPGHAGNELISTLPSLSLRCNVSSYFFFKSKLFLWQMFRWAPFFTSTCSGIYCKKTQCQFHRVESTLCTSYFNSEEELISEDMWDTLPYVFFPDYCNRNFKKVP